MGRLAKLLRLKKVEKKGNKYQIKKPEPNNSKTSAPVESQNKKNELQREVKKTKPQLSKKNSKNLQSFQSAKKIESRQSWRTPKENISKENIPKDMVYVEALGRYVKKSEMEKYVKEYVARRKYKVPYEKLPEGKKRAIDQIYQKSAYKRAFEEDVKDMNLTSQEWTWRYLLRQPYEVKVTKEGKIIAKGATLTTYEFNEITDSRKIAEMNINLINTAIQYLKSEKQKTKKQKSEKKTKQRKTTEDPYERQVKNIRNIPLVGDFFADRVKTLNKGADELRQGKIEGLEKIFFTSGEVFLTGFSIGSIAGGVASIPAAVSQAGKGVIVATKGTEVAGKLIQSVGFATAVEGVSSYMEKRPMKVENVALLTASGLTGQFVAQKVYVKVAKTGSTFLATTAAGAASGAVSLTYASPTYEGSGERAVIGGISGGVLAAGGYFLAKKGVRVVAETVRNVEITKTGGRETIRGFKVGIERITEKGMTFRGIALTDRGWYVGTGKSLKGVEFNTHLYQKSMEGVQAVAPTGVVETKLYAPKLEKTYTNVAKVFFGGKLNQKTIEKQIKSTIKNEADRTSFVKAAKKSGAVLGGSTVERGVELDGKTLQQVNPRFKGASKDLDVVFYSDKSVQKFSKELGIKLQKVPVKSPIPGADDMIKYTGNYKGVKLDISVIEPSIYSIRPASPLMQFPQAFSFEKVKVGEEVLTTYSAQMQIATKSATIGFGNGKIVPLEQQKTKYLKDIKAIEKLAGRNPTVSTKTTNPSSSTSFLSQSSLISLSPTSISNSPSISSKSSTIPSSSTSLSPEISFSVSSSSSKSESSSISSSISISVSPSSSDRSPSSSSSSVSSSSSISFSPPSISISSPQSPNIGIPEVPPILLGFGASDSGGRGYKRKKQVKGNLLDLLSVEIKIQRRGRGKR